MDDFLAPEIVNQMKQDLCTTDGIEGLERLMNESEDIILIDMPVKHRFVPGMYIREIFMQAGVLLTSREHKTEHPFTILKGKCYVFSENDGFQSLEAGHFGITKPGTVRSLYIREDCIWLTYHVLSESEDILRDIGTDENELAEIVLKRIIEERILSDGKTSHELFKEKLNSQRSLL